MFVIPLCFTKFFLIVPSKREVYKKPNSQEILLSIWRHMHYYKAVFFTLCNSNNFFFLWSTKTLLINYVQYLIGSLQWELPICSLFQRRKPSHSSVLIKIFFSLSFQKDIKSTKFNFLKVCFWDTTCPWPILASPSICPFQSLLYGIKSYHSFFKYPISFLLRYSTRFLQTLEIPRLYAEYCPVPKQIRLFLFL